MKKIEEQIKDSLYQVFDPEIMVNIVDMGLIYKIEEKDNIAIINMTLTTPTCPLTSVLEEQIKIVLQGIVDDVQINWVFDPPWSFDKMSESGKEQLRSVGYSI